MDKPTNDNPGERRASPAFAIRIEDPTPTAAQAALGSITVGEFHEQFHVELAYWSAEDYARKWREALRQLVDGRPAVALVTWMERPARLADRRAYVLYRRGQTVYVQETLFLAGDNPAEFDADEHVVNIEPRATVSDDGRPIAEWQTDLAAIRRFLEEPPSA